MPRALLYRYEWAAANGARAGQGKVRRQRSGRIFVGDQTWRFAMMPGHVATIDYAIENSSRAGEHDRVRYSGRATRAWLLMLTPSTVEPTVDSSTLPLYVSPRISGASPASPPPRVSVVALFQQHRTGH